MALIVAPEAPLEPWLAALDEHIHDGSLLGRSVGPVGQIVLHDEHNVPGAECRLVFGGGMMHFLSGDK